MKNKIWKYFSTEIHSLYVEKRYNSETGTQSKQVDLLCAQYSCKTLIG